MENVTSKQETKTGTITRIISDKGYGFIKPSDTGKKSLFFHASRVACPKFEELHEGDKVEYLELETPKGLNAIDVVVLE